MEYNKKQLIALFILISFVLSGFAFAIMSSLTDSGDKDEQLIFYQPLAPEDEQKLISSGKVLLRVYISANCTDCGKATSTTLKLFQIFRSRIAVEIINATQFPQVIDLYSIEKFPTILILGKEGKRAEAVPGQEELATAVCSEFQKPPSVCT